MSPLRQRRVTGGATFGGFCVPAREAWRELKRSSRRAEQRSAARSGAARFVQDKQARMKVSRSSDESEKEATGEGDRSGSQSLGLLVGANNGGEDKGKKVNK